MNTYDIINAGRFTVNGRVVSNSGSIVQLQNLFRNSLPDLDQARDLVKRGNYDALEALYDSVPEVLAQCVRTAFVPEEKFIVADFSSIEARVVAWLAGEKWKLDAFREGKDLYCETASRMFGVNVIKHGENGDLRAKGKIAELACIAERQLVITDKGLVPIERINRGMRLWDGVQWVHHDGVVYKGTKDVITWDGVTATPDHEVYVLPDVKKPIYEAKQHDVKLYKVPALGHREIQYQASYCKVYDILNAGPRHRFTMANGAVVSNCGYGGSVGALKAFGALEMGLTESDLTEIVRSWRTSNSKIVKLWYDLEKAAKEAIDERKVVKTHDLTFTFRGGMLYIRLPSGRDLCYVRPMIMSDRITYMIDDKVRGDTFGGKLVENCLAAGTLVVTDAGLVPIEDVKANMKIWDGEEWVSHDGVVYQGERDVVDVGGVYMTPDHKILTEKGWQEHPQNWIKTKLPYEAHKYAAHPSKHVYDILNCGPRHRFVLWNGMIASNCVQALSRDILCHAMMQLKDYRICGHVHDELIIECPMATGVDDIIALMTKIPPWAEGETLKAKDLLLQAEGYECRFYRKE